MKLRFSRMGKFLLVVAVVLLGVRAALPYGVKWYVNRVLDENPDYDGQIGDVDIHLWRGAYSIDDLKIIKTTGKARIPFLDIRKVDLSVSWRELWRGTVVAKLHFWEPKVNFVDGEKKEDVQTGKGQPWGQVLDKLVPFKISQLLVETGEVHFRNFQASPPVDLWIKDLNARVENLTNSTKSAENLFASCHADGKALGGGLFQLDLKLNPRAEKPTFDLDAKLEKVNLTYLNAFFKKYAKLDFEKGQGDIVAELAADQGKLTGYVKPLLKDLDVVDWEKDRKRDHDSIFHVVWEAIAGALAEIFQNQPKDQLATRIPLNGSLDKPDTDILSTIGGVLTNAFITAFTPFYDNSISLKRRKASASTAE